MEQIVDRINIDLRAKEDDKKKKLADSINKNIDVILKQHMSKIGDEHGFSPREFQKELGLSLSIRKDIERVKIKKILKIGQNSVRVAVEVSPVGWENESTLDFNFEFNGIKGDDD